MGGCGFSDCGAKQGYSKTERKGRLYGRADDVHFGSVRNVSAYIFLSMWNRSSYFCVESDIRDKP
jgi:hypothetical protein